MEQQETPDQGQVKTSGLKKGLIIGAFVLISIPVLIWITGIVAGIIYFGSGEVLGKAETVHAENTAYNLKTAISTYFVEYRKYPVASGTLENKDFLSDHDIMDVLLGKDNPRKVIFFADHEAKPMAGGKYRNGVKMDFSGGGELWDPWGNYYHIRLDLNYDSTVKKPLWDKSSAPAILPESILIWSAGKDGIEGTKDDIKTW